MIKCPACATVWNVNQPDQAQLSPAAKQKAAEEKVESDSESSAMSGGAAVIGVLIGGALMLLVMVAAALIILNREPPPAATATAEVEETIKPREPEPYREINLPEATRRRIYDDYRAVARTSVERPLAIPQGTKVRQDVEVMLQKTFDRELMRFAALHDITVDDVKEVIKEGDAKQWDDSPRSHAVRDGKRVYSKEKSEGWQLNPNRK